MISALRNITSSLQGDFIGISWKISHFDFLVCDSALQLFFWFFNKGLFFLETPTCKTLVEWLLGSSNCVYNDQVYSIQYFVPERFLSGFLTRFLFCRNALLNHFDSPCFVSQTHFHCKFNGVPLCVQLVTSNHKTEETITMQIFAYFDSLFYHFNETLKCYFRFQHHLS